MKKLISIFMIIATMAMMLSACGSAEGQQMNSQPTSTTPSTTTTAPDQQIHLQPQMSVIELRKQIYCSYCVNQDLYEPGDTITVKVTVKNVGDGFGYTGSLENQFADARLVCVDGADSFAITPIETSVTDDAAEYSFQYKEIVEHTIAFVVPDDAPGGSYVLEMSIFGSKVRFDVESAVKEKQLKVLADLPEETQAMIHPEYGSDAYMLHADSYHIYGEFGDVFVFYRYGFASMVNCYEIVNDTCFHYQSTQMLRVYTPEGNYSMAEAFDQGLLTAEQVHEVFYNLLYARSMDYLF